MSGVTACGCFGGRELQGIQVLNPGSWFGKTWLLEIGGSFSPLYLVVEADGAGSAIDELADDEMFGHHIVVADEDLGDYDPETCHYGPSGQVLDLDHLLVHGHEGADCPFPCRYFGEGLPSEGVLPSLFECFDLD